MISSSALRNSLPCDPPKEASDHVLGVSQLVEYKGKTFLNIDLYYLSRLRGRYFADKEEKTHVAFVDGQRYYCMIENVARLCKGQKVLRGDACWYENNWGFATKKDERIALDYLNKRVERFEQERNQVKYERAYQRKRQRIEAKMSEVPCVPQGMKDWVQQQLFSEHYLFMERKNKERTEYSCTACGAQSWKKKRLETWRGDDLSKVRRQGKSLQPKQGKE